MTAPVSFKLAKQLKEKGFDFPRKASQNDYQGEYPTIAEVVMWLFESYKIYIHISPHGQEEDLLEDCRWWFSVYKNKLYNLVGGSKVTKDIEDFGSLTEAYEAAIEYTLKNLLP